MQFEHISTSIPFPLPGYRADGLDGQEDELDDVQKGKLEPPTDDEDGSAAGRGDEQHSDDADGLEDLERRAGIRPM